jgi:MFS transporter, FHS family, glucose/mannose:H+ symporter
VEPGEGPAADVGRRPLLDEPGLHERHEADPGAEARRAEEQRLEPAGRGAGIGLVSLVQARLIEEGAPPDVRRRAFAGLHSMYGLSSLLAPLLVGAILGDGHDWNRAFLLLAALPVGLFLVVIPLRTAAPAPVDAPPAPAPPLRAEVVTSLGLASCVACELVISSRLVLHLQRLGWSPDDARAALSAFFGLLLLGRATLSLVHVGLSNRALLGLSAATTLAATVAGLVLHPLGLVLAGLTIAPFFPTAQARIRDDFPASFDRVMSTALAAVGLTVMATHALVGALSDALDLRRALFVSPAFALLALLLVLAPAGRPGGPANG